MSNYYLQSCEILKIKPVYKNDDNFRSILLLREWGSDNDDILILDTIGELIRLNGDYITFCEYTDLIIKNVDFDVYFKNKTNMYESRYATHTRFLIEFLCKIVSHYYKRRNLNVENNIYIDAFKKPISGLSMAQQYLLNSIKKYHSIPEEKIISIIM